MGKVADWFFWRKTVIHSTVLIGVAAALFFRRPDAFLNPQFWAEDGTVFFKSNFYNAPSFFTPSAGYLHFIPFNRVDCGFQLFNPGYFPPYFPGCFDPDGG